MLWLVRLWAVVVVVEPIGLMTVDELVVVSPVESFRSRLPLASLSTPSVER